jgi:hypothetical protein
MGNASGATVQRIRSVRMDEQRNDTSQKKERLLRSIACRTKEYLKRGARLLRMLLLVMSEKPLWEEESKFRVPRAIALQGSSRPNVPWGAKIAAQYNNQRN